ncbi:hypothetical protein PHLGIDRAFT_503412 [Phlebiopsis gigantea 11061_1 CR5-6]|uniref:Uncharacterized protein n=1 Tax=Phlebiopsis gigantea (strain 11061_1 CR5-6) TaxID=745531 RepID=A0A0C3PB05_PHLG1|nr:hypothetical protein PHLGIDRAFT_503412 [Phlebiopsis gigantea 11061_1 CR5-6]
MSSRPPSHLLPALDSDNEDFDQSFVSDMDNVSVAQPLWQPGLSQAAGPQGAVASSRSQQHGPVSHRQGTEAAYATTVGHGAAAAGVRANTVSHSTGRPRIQGSASARTSSDPRLHAQPASQTRRQHIQGNQVVSAPVLNVPDEAAWVPRASSRGPTSNQASRPGNELEAPQRRAISAGSSASAAGVGVDQMHPVTTGPSGNAVPYLPTLTEVEEYRLKDRETELKVASLEAVINARKKTGKQSDKPQAIPRAHEDEYNQCARRAAAIAIPFLDSEDLTRPFSPEDHLSPARWSSDDAILRGRTAQLYARFPEHLRDDLRFHPNTQKFVIGKAKGQRSTMLESAKQKRWQIFDDQPMEIREAISEKKFDHPGIKALIQGDDGPCTAPNFSSVMYITGRTGEVPGALFKPRHAIRAGRIILWGPSALETEKQGRPHANSVGRKWGIKDFHEIPREFIALSLIICRFILSGDPELTDISKSGFQYATLWETIVLMLHEPNGQPVVDMWTHELLGWCRDGRQLAAHSSGLGLPPTVTPQHDTRVRTLWSSSIPEPWHPDSSSPATADAGSGGAAAMNINHALTEGGEYKDESFGLSENWQLEDTFDLSSCAPSPLVPAVVHLHSTLPHTSHASQPARAVMNSGNIPRREPSLSTRPRAVPVFATPEALSSAATAYNGITRDVPTPAETNENDFDDMYYSPPPQTQTHSQPSQSAHFSQVINPVLHDLEQTHAELHATANAALVTTGLQALSLDAPGDVPEPPATKSKALARNTRGRASKRAGVVVHADPSEDVDARPQGTRMTRNTRSSRKNTAA